MASFPGKISGRAVFLLFLSAACAKTEVRAPGEWADRRSLVDNQVSYCLESARFDEALKVADSLITASPGDSRALAQRSLALAGLGRSAEAIASFEKTLLADYESCENHIHFATYLMRIGKTGRAHTEFMEARRFCEDRYVPLIYRNLAVAAIKLAKIDLAREYTEEGLEASPGDPYLGGLKGMLIAREKPIEAESLFVRAQRGGAASCDFLVQYGLLLINAGRPAEAADVLERAFRLRPREREIGMYLAEALDRAMRPEEAEAMLRSLLAEKDDAEVRGKLARVLFHQKKYEEALDSYMALEQSPEVMDRIAMCLQNLGKPDEALPWERKALAASPDWPQAMINLAVILASKGELDEAEALLERALELAPESVAARSNLERLREARER